MAGFTASASNFLSSDPVGFAASQHQQKPDSWLDVRALHSPVVLRFCE